MHLLVFRYNFEVIFFVLTYYNERVARPDVDDLWHYSYPIGEH